MHYLKIPRERIAVLIGKNGETKREIEKRTNTRLTVEETSVTIELVSVSDDANFSDGGNLNEGDNLGAGNNFSKGDSLGEGNNFSKGDSLGDGNSLSDGDGCSDEGNIGADNFINDYEQGSPNALSEFTAKNIVHAIGRGFSPERAFMLMKGDTMTLEIIHLADFTRSEKAMNRKRGRIIGRSGKSRNVIEDITDTMISVYGKTISIIGPYENVPMAREAIIRLLEGARHSAVYRFLEKWRGHEHRGVSI